MLKTRTQNLAISKADLGLLSFKETTPTSLAPAKELKLYGNIHKGIGTQIIGVEIMSGSRVTDKELVNATSNFHAYSNRMRGIGKQVRGQLVRVGAMPRMMAGVLHDNIMDGDGEQVIGVCCE